MWRGAKPAQDDAAWLIQRRVRTIVNLELLTTIGGVRPGQLSNSGSRAVTFAYPIGSQRRDSPALLDDHVAHFLASSTTSPNPSTCTAARTEPDGVMVAAYRVIRSKCERRRGDRGDEAYRGILFKPTPNTFGVCRRNAARRFAAKRPRGYEIGTGFPDCLRIRKCDVSKR